MRLAQARLSSGTRVAVSRSWAMIPWSRWCTAIELISPSVLAISLASKPSSFVLVRSAHSEADKVPAVRQCFNNCSRTTAGSKLSFEATSAASGERSSIDSNRAEFVASFTAQRKALLRTARANAIEMWRFLERNFLELMMSKKFARTCCAVSSHGSCGAQKLRPTDS